MSTKQPPGDDNRAAADGVSAANSVTTNGHKPIRVDWGHVLEVAAGIVDSFSTPVTLRQLFYQLVARLLIANVQASYKRLSELTAAARRAGDFPDLVDNKRRIHEYLTFNNPADAIGDAVDTYRRDRTQGQECAVYLGVEKDTMVAQLEDWFGLPYGVPILALGGYASQSYCDRIARHVSYDGRPAVLLYAGDFDPSGMDIPRDFAERTDCFEEIRRVALNPDQIGEYNLPPMPGKTTDSRAGGFVAEFGRLVQVELEALSPDVLQGLYGDALAEFWDMSTYEAVVTEERTERAAMREFARRWQG
jgi:hypothetical protein